MEFDKQLLVTQHFLFPRGGVELLQFVEGLLREFHAVPVNVLVAGHPANGRFTSQRATKEQVIGASIGSFTGPETDPEVSKKMRNHMLRGEPGSGENTLYRADG